MPRINSQSRASIALGNLRAVVILIVLAFHSMLAYVSWIPATTADFNSPPYNWRAFPIVDNERFFGFDLFCAWQDVYLMALMFFLSGLFVWPSLMRKKEWGYLRDRLLRLGLPYVFGIAILIPAAVYPAYRVTAVDPSLAGYWQHLIELPFWPTGPLWFIGQLLLLNIIAVAVNLIAPDALKALGRWSATAGSHPTRYGAVLLGVSAVAYVPLAIAFTPWAWADTGLFAVQYCRPLLYAVYFFAGIGLGAQGLDRGLMAADGLLARYWGRGLAAALISLFVWMGLTALTMNGEASLGVQVADDLSFVVACAAGCCFIIGVCLRFATSRSRLLDSLSGNAYGLYLVHYDFVVWLQFALFGTALLAVIKATIVFAVTLLASWLTVLAVQRIPFGARLIGVAPRAMAAS